MNNLREMLPPGDRGTYNATVVKVAKQFTVSWFLQSFNCSF